MDAGEYVSEVSARKLAESIVALLDNPARREEMGRKGYARLHQDLNWEKSVEELLRAYQTALNPSK